MTLDPRRIRLSGDLAEMLLCEEHREQVEMVIARSKHPCTTSTETAVEWEQLELRIKRCPSSLCLTAIMAVEMFEQ